MTVRIDTLRNQLAGTRHLLDMAMEELEDLHVLAYDRPAASEDLKVASSNHDYALDTHGDKRARDAYRRLGNTVAQTCDLIDYAINEALKLLREGDTPARHTRRLQLIELAEAIAAQSRRTARGDYRPVRRGPQPDDHQALGQAIADRDNLNRRLTAANKRITQLENDQRDRRDHRSKSWREQVS